MPAKSDKQKGFMRTVARFQKGASIMDLPMERRMQIRKAAKSMTREQVKDLTN